MSDPNLPEGVTQKDIDRTCGETMSDEDRAVEDMKLALRFIKEIFEYSNDYHTLGCSAWEIVPSRKYRTVFNGADCDCAIGEILHKIEMLEDFI